MYDSMECIKQNIKVLETREIAAMIKFQLTTVSILSFRRKK